MICWKQGKRIQRPDETFSGRDCTGLNKMKKRSLIRSIQFIVLIFLLSVELPASQVIDRMFFTGVSISYHDRVGHLSFSDGSEQDIARNEIPSVGLLVGKRFALPWKLRLHVPVNLDYGSAREEPEESFDGVKKSSLFHFGLVPVLQLPLRLNSESAFYLSFGSGLHLVRFTENTIDDFMYFQTCSSVSLTGGAGFEVMTAKNRAVTVQYTLRYGKPVHYKYMKWDLFPYKGLDYKETIFTHSIQFIVMVYKSYRPL
jgi:hypothetical protein